MQKTKIQKLLFLFTLCTLHVFESTAQTDRQTQFAIRSVFSSYRSTPGRAEGQVTGFGHIQGSAQMCELTTFRYFNKQNEYFEFMLSQPTVNRSFVSAGFVLEFNPISKYDKVLLTREPSGTSTLSIEIAKRESYMSKQRHVISFNKNAHGFISNVRIQKFSWNWFRWSVFEDVHCMDIRY